MYMQLGSPGILRQIDVTDLPKTKKSLLDLLCNTRHFSYNNDFSYVYYLIAGDLVRYIFKTYGRLGFCRLCEAACGFDLRESLNRTFSTDPDSFERAWISDTLRQIDGNKT